MDDPLYSLRQANSNDYAFLYRLHADTMRPYVEQLWGWEEAWQQEYFARKFDPQNRQIIVIDGQDAGVLYIEEHQHEIYLALIEIAPAFQGRGVGTAILNSLIILAGERHVPLNLHVLKSNKPARRLYERLGFAVVGEEQYRCKMCCSPASAAENGS
ncbi:MAG: GNAT family N-acetyltransferase [Candidatus Promineifilaceae bacterium]|jgi:ribosomal protein S18 acetylase RimI-like enzyme